MKVPIRIENVSLEMLLSVDTPDLERKFQQQFEIINQLKAKFGNDTLLDELMMCVCGTVESIRLVGSEQAVNQEYEKIRLHRCTSQRFAGYVMGQIDPRTIEHVLKFETNTLSEEDYYAGIKYVELSQKKS